MIQPQLASPIETRWAAPRPALPVVLQMPIRERDDGLVASAVVRHAACDLDLAASVQHRLALTAAELATNLIKHAGGGRLEFRADARVLELWSFDRGPGVARRRLRAPVCSEGGGASHCPGPQLSPCDGHTAPGQLVHETELATAAGGSAGGWGLAAIRRAVHRLESGRDDKGWAWVCASIRREMERDLKRWSI